MWIFEGLEPIAERLDFGSTLQRLLDECGDRHIPPVGKRDKSGSDDAFARAVWTDNCSNPGVEVELRLVGERLEADERETLEHDLGPGKRCTTKPCLNLNGRARP